MDIAEATQQDIVKVIDGHTLNFKRLTMRDVGQLATMKQQIDANNLHVSIQALKDAGVKPDQLPAVIQELTKAPSHSEIVRWAFTTEGALAIVDVAGHDLSGSFDHAEIHFLALDLIGVEYEREEVESEGSIPFSRNLDGDEIS